MKKGLTELVFIIDKSGSMSGLEADTIGGFNSMIEKQKEMEGEVIVSTIFFNHTTTVIHDRVPIEKIEPLTEKDYCVGGSTALIDALCGSIYHIGDIHKYAKEEDVPEHTIFVITTDGMENASRRYTLDKVRYLILNQQTKYNWEFTFLGANIDAIEVANYYGIPEYNAANYMADSDGIKDMYMCLEQNIRYTRLNKRRKDRKWAETLDKKMNKDNKDDENN